VSLCPYYLAVCYGTKCGGGGSWFCSYFNEQDGVAAKICILEVLGLNLIWGIPGALLYAFSRFPQSFRSCGGVLPRLCHGHILPNHLLQSPRGPGEGQRHTVIHRKHLRPRSLFSGVMILFSLKNWLEKVT